MPSQPLYQEQYCLICGTTVPRLDNSQYRKKYCSRECRVSAIVTRNKKSAERRKRKTDVTCFNCGIIFEKYIYRTSPNKKNFCSRECTNAWQDRTGHRVHLRCELCNSEFTRSRYFYEVRKNTRFCSRKCLDKYNSINKRGSKNINWSGGHPEYYGPNWSEQKRLAKKRDGYKCKRCNIIPDKRHLEVHHIIKFKLFGYILNENDNYLLANRLENLVSLCSECHRKVEKRPALLSDNQFAPVIPIANCPA